VNLSYSSLRTKFDTDQEIYTNAFGMYADALGKFIIFDQENALISGRVEES
jgi:hypothetical protein